MEEDQLVVINVELWVNNLSMWTKQEKEKWKKHCIYKLPAWVTDLNVNAYKPRVISLGPYHHGYPKLISMEYHKGRASLHFLRRSRKQLADCVEVINGVRNDLIAAYDSLDPKWQEKTEAFSRLMINDGCFLLEILRHGAPSLYAENDPIFSAHGKRLLPYIKRDMLMLENQLPMLLLTTLLSFEAPTAQGDVDDYVNNLIVNFCTPSNRGKSLGKCKHVLDVYRKSLLWEDHSSSPQAPSNEVMTEGNREGSADPPSPMEGESTGRMEGRRLLDTMENYPSISRDLPPTTEAPQTILDQLPSATELHEAGIKIKKSKTGNIKDISFDDGILSLPTLVVDDTTEPVFLNLIAYELFHPEIGNEVTSYVAFMDDIIDNVKDVNLLRSLEIIHNAVGSDEALANLFNSLSKDVSLSPHGSLSDVRREATMYSRKAWNRWRGNLIHTYFRSPWALLSLIAAIFIFALTIVQTIYTVGQYYQ